MATTAQTLPSIKAKVQTVIVTNKEGGPLMKKRADGSEAPVQLCGLVFTEGPLKNKTTWAQRSLTNRDGVAKEGVAVGDEVFATHTGVINGKNFFEVTTAVNATDEDITAALAAMAGTAPQTVDTNKKVEIPLQV